MNLSVLSLFYHKEAGGCTSRLTKFTQATLAALMCFLFVQVSYAQYSNGPLSTGATAKNGAAAPVGFTWSEVQNTAGNTTESNTAAGSTGSFNNAETTSFVLADNFTVPCGSTWDLTSIAVFAYQTNSPAATFPIDQIRMAIFNGDPSLPGSSIVFGDLTTNRLNAGLSGNESIFRIFNTTTPAPGTGANTARIIRRIVANTPVSLPAGNYWIAYQVHATNDGAVFFPNVTLTGIRGLPCWNAKQRSSAGVWTNIIDGGNPASAPDFAQDMPFVINGTNIPNSLPIFNTIAYAGTPLCSNATSSNVSLTANNYCSTGGIPTTPTSGGTYTATPAGLSINAATGVINPSASTAGAYTVTYAVSPGCPLATASVAVSAVVAAPTASSPQVLCGGPNAIVSSLIATGSNIQWYSTPTGGAALAPATPLVNGATYYASQTVGTCESTTRTPVVAVVSPQVTLTKTPGAPGSINYATNPDEYISEITLRLTNTTGVQLTSVFLEEVLNTPAGAFLNLVEIPEVVGNAVLMPQFNPAWNGSTNTSIFTNDSGVLNPGEYVEVTLQIRFNAQLLNSFCIANTTNGGGVNNLPLGPCPSTLSNAQCVGSAPPSLVNLPSPLNVNVCDNYESIIQQWLAIYGGATFNHQGRTVEVICNDYCEPHGWQYLDNCSKNATLPVIFTVKYTDGSMMTYSSTINLIDPQVVEFVELPQGLSVDCANANAASEVQAWINANGGAEGRLCGGLLYFSNNYDGNLPAACGAGKPVTFTITNECGLTASAVAMLTVTDNVAPLLSGLPANTTINCGEAVPAAATVTATDACTPNVTVNLSQWVASISGNLSGANEVPANNSSASGRVFAQLTGDNLQIVIAFNGLTAPASAAHIHEAAAGVNGPVRINFGALGFPVGATSGVFTTSVTLTPALQTALAAGSLYVNIHNSAFPGGEVRAQLNSQCTNTTIRVWSASDACNNNTIAMRTVSEIDTQAPTFTSVPASVTVDCDAATPAFGTATATDACSSVTVTFSDVTTGTVCTGIVSTRTFTATDGCGNSATASQRITKSADTASPTFTSVPSNNTYACGGTPSLGSATATDACSSVTVTFTDSQGAGNCSGASTIRTFTATDGCGNTATATQESTPEVDVVPPTFGPLTDVIEIVCGDAVVFESPTTSDNCTAVTLTHTDEVNGDVCAGIMNIRRWTATDACGNTATAKQTVWQIGDTTDPEYTNLIDDESVFLCGETPDYDSATAVDGCGGDVTITYQLDYDYEDTCHDGYGYYTKVRYKATDACGNENNETITIHFVPEDHRMAFMYKPQDKTVSCSEAYTFDAVHPKVVSYDGAISSVTFEDIAALTPCGSGTVTRRWTATDVVGNQAIAEQTVTILADTELPTITLANNSIVVDCASAITVEQPTVSDNCASSSEITLTYSDINVENTVERTWTAQDACGNVANATQIYVILDTQAPVFTTALQNKTISCDATVAFDNATAIDACSAVTLTHEDTQAAINCGVTHTRTWKAVDALGHEATIAQTITVLDQTAPVFSFVPANQVVVSAAEVNFGTPQVTDNCQNALLSYTDAQTAPICGNTGYTVTRTWVANDGCNNQAVAAQQISVALDTQAPTFTSTPTDKSIEMGDAIVFDALTAVDNNGDATVTYTDIQGAPICGNSGYTVTRIWTATDACNNNTIATQAIHVGLDVTAPAFAIALLDKTITCGGLMEFDSPIATDNSGEVQLSYTDVQSTPTCGNTGYTMTRTFTAIDACNNAVQMAQAITMAEDTEAPAFIGSVNDVEMTQAAFNTWVPMAPAAADNCQAVEVTVGAPVVVDECNYKVDYTATDACGNFAIRTQNIKIVDCLVLGTNEGVLSSVSIYPNPVETELNIVLSAEVDLKNVTAQVFDMLGKQVVMTQVVQHQSNINVSTLATGTYTLRLTAEGGVKAVKFVKQ